MNSMCGAIAMTDKAKIGGIPADTSAMEIDMHYILHYRTGGILCFYVAVDY